MTKIFAPLITYLIILRNSSVPNPRVVHAGVPNLIPDVIIGLSLSKGIPFLLQVMLALPNEACASFPVTPKDLKSINIK